VVIAVVVIVVIARGQLLVVAAALIRVGEHVPGLVQGRRVGLRVVVVAIGDLRLPLAVRGADVGDRCVGLDTDQVVIVVATHAASGRVRTSATSRSIGTRACSIVSRSRMVTAWSSSESKSTVTHRGVPTSSWRR